MPGNDVIHPICDRWGRMHNFDFCSTVEPDRTWPYMTWINPEEQRLRVRDAQDDDWVTIGGSGGGGAPSDASYLVLALDADLSAERRLIVGDGLQATDAGPNGDYTLAIKVADFAGTGLENDGANNLRIAAAAAGDGLTGGGGSALAVSVTAIAGTGLENDGSNNLRIAAAAAGDGLTGGGGAALAVDATVVRTSGDQSIAGLKSFTDGIALGTTPAQSGILRLPQATWIVARNSTDTADVNMWKVQGAGMEAGCGLTMKNQQIQGVYAIYQNSVSVWALDNNGNALFYGNVTLSGPSRALKGAASSFPDLGTTTLAEKMGHIYQATGKDIYPDNSTYGLHSRFEDIFGDDAPTAPTDFVRYATLAMDDVPASNQLGFLTDTTPNSDSYTPDAPFSKSNSGTVRFYVSKHHLRVNTLAGSVNFIWNSATAKNYCELYLQWMTRAATTYGGEIRGWEVQSPGAGQPYWAVRFKYDVTTYPDWPWRVQLYSGTGTTFAIGDGTLQQDSPWDPFNTQICTLFAQSGPTCSFLIGGYHSQLTIEVMKKTVATMPPSFKRIQVYVNTSYQQISLDSIRLY